MMSLRPSTSIKFAARTAGKALVPAPVRVVKAAAKSGVPSTPEFDTEAVSKQAQEAAATVAKDLAAKWEATEEKPAAVAISVAALFAVYLAAGIMSAVDRLPLFSGLFEMVGIGASAWFTYRYLIYGPDREELAAKASAFIAKVAGK